MKLVIEIDMENATLADDDYADDLARMLEILAETFQAIRRPGLPKFSPYPLIDLNGNKVGECRVVES